MQIANIPTIFIWLYFAIKARSLFFFSSVNPSIETGGMLGESKACILDLIAEPYIPTSILVNHINLDFNKLSDLIASNKLDYPIIAKPNVGERGIQVQKINNFQELEVYAAKSKVDFILQNFVEYDVELSILYWRCPHEDKGHISSVCEKELLHVIGDGKSAVVDLLKQNTRGRLQIKRLTKHNPDLIKYVPNRNEKLVVEPIGNHSRGTKFIDRNDWIDEDLVSVFDTISSTMHGVLFGRFDLKCSSLEALKEGKDIRIVEFNGVSAEPAHIYDPKHTWKYAYKELYKHWEIIYTISEKQRNLGFPSMSFKDAWVSWKKHRLLMQAMRDS